MSNVIKALFVVCRKVMVSGVAKTHTDNNGMPFRPLAPSTVERKQRQGLSLNPLVATGAMLAPKTWKVRVSKQKGRMTHLAPKGSHTKYGRSGRKRPVKFDYALAHQYSNRVKLPRRQWGLEPGTKKWKAVENMIPRLMREHAKGGASSPYALVSKVFSGTGFD